MEKCGWKQYYSIYDADPNSILGTPCGPLGLPEWLLIIEPEISPDQHEVCPKNRQHKQKKPGRLGRWDQDFPIRFWDPELKWSEEVLDINGFGGGEVTKMKRNVVASYSQKLRGRQNVERSNWTGQNRVVVWWRMGRDGRVLKNVSPLGPRV